MENFLYQPIHQRSRIVIVDVLRGWALFGVVLMNYFDFFTLGRNWETYKPDLFANILMYVTSILFSAKSWTLLSLLFGYGFAVLMNNVKEKGHHPYGFFAGRMFWLLVLAIINSALFFGDILKDYAVLGLLMLVFYNSSARTTFMVSLILLLGMPALASYVYSLKNESWSQFPSLFPLYLSHNPLNVLWFGLKGTWLVQITSRPYLYTVHVVMFCCMLWGFSLYKINFFNDLASKIKYIKRTFWISFVIAVFLILANTFVLPALVKNGIDIYKYYNIRYWSILSVMFTIGSGICWLYTAGKLKAIFNNFAIIGKMTLTNYMMQNLLGVLIFSGFGLGIWNTKPLWIYLLLAIVIYILQIYFSKWWLSKYNYGPVEWIWRQLSYRKRLPLKK